MYKKYLDEKYAEDAKKGYKDAARDTVSRFFGAEESRPAVKARVGHSAPSGTTNE